MTTDRAPDTKAAKADNRVGDKSPLSADALLLRAAEYVRSHHDGEQTTITLLNDLRAASSAEPQPVVSDAVAEHLEETQLTADKAWSHCKVDSPEERRASAVRAAIRRARMALTDTHAQAATGQAVDYLCDGRRFKLHSSRHGAGFTAFPKELIGAWVALVDATDGKHLAASPPPHDSAAPK